MRRRKICVWLVLTLALIAVPSRPIIIRIMPIIGMSPPPAIPPGIPGPAAVGGAGG